MYKKLLKQGKINDSIKIVNNILNQFKDQNSIENFVYDAEEYVDDLYQNQFLSYKEYDNFLTKLWKLSDSILFNSEGMRINDVLNMRILDTPIKINDIVTFKKVKDNFLIPTPYRILKINNDECSLINLLNNEKYKTKLNYLDKRDENYFNQNFGDRKGE